MDVMRALASPNLDIRQKTLDLAMDLITSRNIDEVRLLSSLASHSLLNPEPRSGRRRWTLLRTASPPRNVGEVDTSL